MNQQWTAGYPAYLISLGQLVPNNDLASPQDHEHIEHIEHGDLSPAFRVAQHELTMNKNKRQWSSINMSYSSDGNRDFSTD